MGSHAMNSDWPIVEKTHLKLFNKEFVLIIFAILLKDIFSIVDS